MSASLSPRTEIQFPEKMQFLFRPKRYKVLHGGRGSAKSWSVARALILLAAAKKMRMLCAREYQTSITESVHQLLKEQIEALGVERIYEVQQKVIRCVSTGSDFVFAGIKTDPRKIKSAEGVDVCWVEEAEKVSAESWRFLIPTIRKDNSEIWVTFNPDQETDPTAKRFLSKPPPDSIVRQVNWQDNPWFPETLRKEKDYDYRVDPAAAAHVWGGQFRKGSDAQIFRGKYTVASFEPHETWDGPYFGADWGFSNDPTTLIKMYLFERRLYVEYEAYGVGVELNQIAQFFESVPGSRLWVKTNEGKKLAAQQPIIRADNSRPETIVHVAAEGFNVVPADKWPGSVEDGITWLRALEQIVIHPRCKHAEEEARLYSYKTDRITGDVLPVILDKHNHTWDAIRYGLAPAIKIPDEDVVYEHSEMRAITPELDEIDEPALGQGF